MRHIMYSLDFASHCQGGLHAFGILAFTVVYAEAISSCVVVLVYVLGGGTTGWSTDCAGMLSTPSHHISVWLVCIGDGP
jgi:hypothetical protein